jgi:hypothetical protein
VVPRILRESKEDSAHCTSAAATSIPLISRSGRIDKEPPSTGARTENTWTICE